jgi:adenosylhomocysteine nucleosidase
MKFWYLASFFSLALYASFAAELASAETLDTVPRTAVMSAYEPEWIALQAMLHDRRDRVINGTIFATGTIEGKPVVLFLSGISMVNAAMNAQLALDRFTIQRIVFSGVAGGVDPNLATGGIVVPDQWSEYLEVVFAREEKDGGYTLPSHAERVLDNYGVMFPQRVQIATGGGEPEKRLWFPVDGQLLAIARTAAATALKDCAAENKCLKDCTAENKCLTHKPTIVVGGNGVSGQAFLDNKAFREYARKTFDAEVADMESAAVAHVAYANKTPFIAFRSLSDLAGGEDGKNEMETFARLASDNSALFVKTFLKALH